MRQDNIAIIGYIIIILLIGIGIGTILPKNQNITLNNNYEIPKPNDTGLTLLTNEECIEYKNITWWEIQNYIPSYPTQICISDGVFASSCVDNAKTCYERVDEVMLQSQMNQTNLNAYNIGRDICLRNYQEYNIIYSVKQVCIKAHTVREVN